MRGILRLLLALVAVSACGPMAMPQSECKALEPAYNFTCPCSHQMFTIYMCSSEDSDTQCTDCPPACGFTCCSNWTCNTCSGGTCVTVRKNLSLMLFDPTSGLSESGSCPGSQVLDLQIPDKQPKDAKEPAGPPVKKDKPSAAGTSS
jgi:hypothetical protein